MRTRTNGPGANRPRSIRFLGTSACLVLLLTFVLVSPVMLGSAQAVGSISRETSFPRPGGDGAIGASGNILLDPAARRGYQISRLDRTVLSEFDLDTLEVLRRVNIPRISEAPAQRSTDWQWTIDPANKRLLFLIDDYEGSFETRKLVSMNLNSLTVSDPITLWPYSDSIPLSFSFHPPSDRLYMLVRKQVDALGAALEVEERSTNGTLVGQHRLTSCFGALDFNYPPTTVRSVLDTSRLFLNCYNYNGIQSQVVKINLGSNGSLDDSDAEEVFPAVPGPLSTLFDAGSDRIFFLTANKGAGRGAWVFDGARDSFLGVIATGDTEAGRDYGIGVNPSTGRVYMQTPAGFLVADARRTPLPSGLLFKDMVGNGFGKIEVDPVLNRMFVPDPKSANSLGLPQRFMVLRDSIPLSKDVPQGNPDNLTADIEEKDGITGANLSAGGRSFGIRSLTTGGLQRGVWNIALGNTAPDDLPAIEKALYSLPLDPDNRDIYFARVRKVELTDRETGAEAIYSDADEATTNDLEAQNSEWLFLPTSCSDATGTPSSTVGSEGMSSTSCNSTASTVWASAGSREVESPGETLKVRATSATGSISRNTAKGLISTSQAVVRGISIGSSVRIGELRTLAQTWAKGRSGKAGGLFERTLSDVAVDTNGDGTFDYRCPESCETEPTAEAIARALGGRATVLFPEPDPAYVNGSPGGFQAIIEKNRFLSYSERSLNDDDTPEVVGMEVIYYADAKAGRSRQVFQLAGVQAESHYGIYALPGFSHGTDSGFVDFSTTGLPFFTPDSFELGPDVGFSAPVLGVSKARFEKVVEKIAAGWRFLLTNAPDAILLAGMWSLFLLPLYLIGRRRFISI